MFFVFVLKSFCIFVLMNVYAQEEYDQYACSVRSFNNELSINYFEDPLTSLFIETDDIASSFEGQKYNTKKRDFM